MVNQNKFPTLTYDTNKQSDFTKQMLDLGIIKKSNVQLTGEERDRFTGVIVTYLKIFLRLIKTTHYLIWVQQDTKPEQEKTRLLGKMKNTKKVFKIVYKAQ